MHFKPSVTSRVRHKLHASLHPASRTLRPILLAMVASLASLAVHAGSCNFTTPGAATCSIPAGVAFVNVVATGGGGGGTGEGYRGGNGGVVTQTLSGVGGTTLNLFVGGGGGAGAGFAGIGPGGGGGSSNVNAGTTPQIIAGGGGGGGCGFGGNGDGSNGSSICPSPSSGGRGGRGGSGGNSGSELLYGGQGGHGGSGNGGGGGEGVSFKGIGGEGGIGAGGGSGGPGGGGGGYGGGGYFGGGGGGGSTGGTVTVASNGSGGIGGDGSIVITWTDPPVPVTALANPLAGGTVSCTPNPVPYGGASICTATANPGYTLGAFSGDCAGANCLLGNVTSAKSVTANFTPVGPLPPTALIPSLGNPVPGLATGAPQRLNMASGIGPTVIAGIVRVLQNGGFPGVQYVRQSPTGAVVLSTPSGQDIVFGPTGVQGNDNRADGWYPLGNGQYQFVVNGVALTVTPAVQNLDQLLALLPVGTTVNMNSNGSLIAKLGGLTYVVQPGVFTQVLGNPGGIPVLGLGIDGYQHFTDAAGNDQPLYPAFIEPDALLRILQTLDANATLNIQLDGTAKLSLNATSYTLVPDLTLGGVTAGQEAIYWWQEGPVRYRTRVLSSWLDLLSDGFTVRQK